MKNKLFVLSALVFVFAGCKELVGDSFVTDIPQVLESPSNPSTPPPPVVPPAGLTLSSTSLRVGSLLTISSTSTDLSSPTAVTINGTAALVLNTSANQMQVYVMPGSTSGYVGVATSGGIDYAATQVTVQAATAGVSYTQEGDKMVGVGIVGAGAYFGTSLKVSADGSTAAIGGPVDNSNEGGVWVYSRNGASWTQQGLKLVGTDAVSGTALQGFSVALSADGNTLMSGGAADDNQLGAVWFFTRNGATWTQQGPKIVPTDAIGAQALFGMSGDLSADGNTAIIGGAADNSQIGAAWIYTRNGSSWTEQAKLVASDAIGTSTQGWKVALSADGNTAVVGAAMDDSMIGAAWIYTRSGSTWTQQAKLIGTGHLGNGAMGYSVAISANGNTVAVSGPYDDSTNGAVWIFTRSGTSWSEESKLIATGNIGAANIGYSVALTADGNTAVLGGPNDNTMIGASWIFTRSGTTWTERNKLLGTGGVANATMSMSSSISADGSVMMCGGAYDNSFMGGAWSFGK